MSEGGLAAAIAAESGVAGDGGAGGEGGAAAGGAAAGGGAGAGGGGEGGQGGGGDPWYASIADEELRDWVKAKNPADPATLVKSYRELEKQYRSGDKIVLPKEGASEDELNAFYAKIGRPEKPDGYEIKAPEGTTLDEGLVAKFRETAFKAGLPAAAAGPLVEMFNGHVSEMLEAQEAERATARGEGIAAVKKEWGAATPQNMAAANRAMTALGLSGDDVDAIADALPPELGEDGSVKRNGTARALDLLRRLGAGMGEDVLSGGGAARKFGLSPAEAQAKLDEMAADPATVKKLEAKDPTLTARRAQLIEIVAAGEDAENRRG